MSAFGLIDRLCSRHCDHMVTFVSGIIHCTTILARNCDNIFENLIFIFFLKVMLVFHSL